MASKEFEDVRAFHLKFGLLCNDQPTHLTQAKLKERHEVLLEEVYEFGNAIPEQDLGKQADALVDLVYFALGTAAMLGIPWEEMWEEVHAANMRKVRGVTHRGHKVDVAKPEGWVGPDNDAVLERAGYERKRWCLADGVTINEEQCDDDH